MRWRHRHHHRGSRHPDFAWLWTGIGIAWLYERLF